VNSTFPHFLGSPEFWFKNDLLAQSFPSPTRRLLVQNFEFLQNLL
jgi:hypothetical protein